MSYYQKSMIRRDNMDAKTFNRMYEAFLNLIPDEDEPDGL